MCAGLRLYHGSDVEYCLLETTPGIEDVTLFCDINSMVIEPRCDEDGLGDVAFEIENFASLGLVIDGFYVNEYHVDTFDNGNNATFTLDAEMMAVVYINETGDTYTITSLDIDANADLPNMDTCVYFYVQPFFEIVS